MFTHKRLVFEMNALALLSENYNTDDEDIEMSDSDMHSTPEKNEKEK